MVVPARAFRHLRAMTELLTHLLTADPSPVECATLDAWWPRLLDASAPFATTLDRAAAAGFAADRLGWAFAAGYHHALRALVPSLAADEPAALAATEEGGGHPRAIATALRPTADGYALDGAKTFVTLGRHARTLLVVASTGLDATGLNALRLVAVAADAPGLTLDALPATPFAPEIEHARATFTGVSVRAGAVLPGDGYALYLKPFRTLEDLHVVGAALGHLLAAARRHAWPEAVAEELVATLVAVRALAGEDPARASTHVALAGVFRALGRSAASAEEGYAALDGEEGLRWRRDRDLLRVAKGVRELRRAAAWQSLAGRRAPANMGM